LSAQSSHLNIGRSARSNSERPRGGWIAGGINHSPIENGFVKFRSEIRSAAVACIVLLVPATHARAQTEPNLESLAKTAQNPVADLISVPFQENANLNAGPYDRELNVFNIQPVIPFSVNDDWNIITRTILPIISQPGVVPNQGRTDGLGDTQISALLSPAKPSSWIWAVGAITQLPTHTAQVLGNDHVGLGPTVAVLRLEQGSPWVYGVLLNNVWSTGNSRQPSYNNGLVQMFCNYNFKGGTYLTSSPIFTANWEASRGSQKFTVPVGGGVGRIFKIGKLPLNTQISAYYNVVRPDFSPNWQLRLQVQLLFPK
jgi:hypothetical protein